MTEIINKLLEAIKNDDEELIVYYEGLIYEIGEQPMREIP